MYGKLKKKKLKKIVYIYNLYATSKL